MAAMDVNGIFIPVATPFDEAGEVDWDALRRNMQGWAAAPLKGYLALGSTSEFPSLDRAEKERVLTTIVQEAAGRTVIVQTGEQSTRATIEWTKRAAELGGQAALVVSPYYYKGLMSDKALQGFYEQVADASPIPTLIYNIPQNTGLNVPPRWSAAWPSTGTSSASRTAAATTRSCWTSSPAPRTTGA